MVHVYIWFIDFKGVGVKKNILVINFSLPLLGA